MLTPKESGAHAGRNRTVPLRSMPLRLTLATVLFYAVAVLYYGTAGHTGLEAFVQPIIGTAVFAGVLMIPLAVGAVAMRRAAEPQDA